MKSDVSEWLKLLSFKARGLSFAVPHGCVSEKRSVRAVDASLFKSQGRLLALPHGCVSFRFPSTALL